jgi:hypothetical protein
MKKKKIKIVWLCSNFTKHRHQYKWTAQLCGSIQKFFHKVVVSKNDTFKIGIHCFSYHYYNRQEECRCHKNINKCGHYFICYMPNFIKEEYEIHSSK